MYVHAQDSHVSLMYSRHFFLESRLSGQPVLVLLVLVEVKVLDVSVTVEGLDPQKLCHNCHSGMVSYKKR